MEPQTVFKLLQKMKGEGWKLLIRTNWIVGGVVVGVTRKDTIYGVRNMYEVVRPDGRKVYEYADRLMGGTLQSCVYEFKDYPIVLTERKVPSVQDELKLFNPIITGIEAKSWVELIADLNAKHQIIHHQANLIYSMKTKEQMLESKLEALGSELRMIREEYEMLKRENTELKSALGRIRNIAEMAIHENYTKDEIIKKILKEFDMISGKIVQTPEEVVEDVINLYTKAKAKLEVAVAGNGEMESIRSEIAELREKLKKLDEIEKLISKLSTT